MAIEVLTDVILPESVVRAGVQGKNVRNNLRTMTLNGYASVNVNWTKTLRQFEIGIAPMNLDVWQEIEGLHEATEGGAYGFLMLDPKDQAAITGEGELYPYSTGLIGESGKGYGVPTYKLFKKYTGVGGSRIKRRQITRPKDGTLSIKRGSASVTPTVNYDNGTVTFNADKTQSVLSHTVGTTHILAFSSADEIVAQITVGMRVYLTGVAGTAASILNNMSHEVTSVDAVNKTITLALSTSGKTATGGTAAKYPQASETLTWSGTFYVPVHFLDDTLEWELLKPGPLTGRLISGVQIIVQEIRE